MSAAQRELAGASGGWLLQHRLQTLHLPLYPSVTLPAPPERWRPTRGEEGGEGAMMLPTIGHEIEREQTNASLSPGAVTPAAKRNPLQLTMQIYKLMMSVSTCSSKLSSRRINHKIV